MSSIFEQVAENIIETLEGMTVETHGFVPLVRRIGTAQRPTTKGLTNGDDAAPGEIFTVEIEVQQPRIEMLPPEEFGKSYFWQHFNLVCFVSRSDQAEDSLDTTNNTIYSGIIIALMEDARRGEIAIDTKVGDCNIVVNPAGAYEGVIIDVRVQVCTSQFNPNSL